MNGAGQILLRVPASAAVQAPRCSGPAAGASAAELRLDRSRLSRWYRPTSPCTGPHPRTSLLYLMIGVGVVIPIILSYQAYGYGEDRDRRRAAKTRRDNGAGPSNGNGRPSTTA